MRGKGVMRIVERSALILVLLFALSPLLIAISTSLKTTAEIVSDPLGFPRSFYFANYIDAIVVTNLGRAFLTSTILTVGTVLGVFITATPAAYALSKIKFPGGPFLMAYVFFSTTIPAQIFIIPLFHIFARIGFVNSLPGLILIYIAVFSPFAMLLMRSYFINTPDELFDAALVDGASKWQAFWRVIVPVVRPGIAIAMVIVAMGSWNQFLLPRTFLLDPRMQTVTLALVSLQGQWTVEWGMLFAVAILISLPILIMFILLHRQISAGLASTGLKR